MATEVEVLETEVQSSDVVDLPQNESDAPPQKGLKKLLKWGKNNDGEEKMKSRKPPGIRIIVCMFYWVWPSQPLWYAVVTVPVMNIVC